MKNKNKYTKFRHRFLFPIAKFIIFFFAKSYHFKYKKFKIKKNEQYFILSNHQTLFDPVFLLLSFNKPLYIVAGDSLFNKSLGSKLIRYISAPIKKSKSLSDVSCIRNCLKVSKEGGSILIFPEGNRAWAEFQFYIDPSIVRLARKMNMPILLYLFKGGFGINPCWGKKRRKGKFTGEVSQVISLEEMNNMTDEELYIRICDGLKVFDSSSKELYKSEERAEYLEKQFFVCPKCQSISTLVSDKEHIRCNHCGLDVTYNEDLTLSSSDPEFKFKLLVDWYNYQLTFIKNYQVKDDEIIFTDRNVTLINKTTEDVEILEENVDMYLNNKHFMIGNTEIKIENIISATVFSGKNLLINTDDKNYTVKGPSRYNALKYILFLNILSTRIKEEYFSLDLK